MINLLWKIPLPQRTSKILKDYAWHLIAGIKEEYYESSDQIPKNLKNAILKIEDKRYYYHRGIDPIAILRAVHFNLLHSWKRQGASTIPQQLIKLSQKAYQRSWQQKIKEMLMAFNLSLHFSKEDILLSYLNHVEFLNGIQGYKAACKSYFWKSCAALFPSELSFLLATAQMGKNPLQEKSFQLIKKKAKTLCIHAFWNEVCEHREELPPLSVKELSLPSNTFSPHFSHYQKKKEETNQNSLFDISLYQEINKLIEETRPYREQVAMEDCCTLVLNKQGAIRSMNTCRPFEESKQGQVNGCLKKRQTGSAIKPFLYSFAMKTLGLTWGTSIVDEPVSYELDSFQSYSPKNFSLQYYGEVSLADALGSSLNIPAVKLVHEVGVQAFLDFLLAIRKQFWSSSPEELVKDEQQFSAEQLGLSVALGTYEMSPLHFAELWRFFFDEQWEKLEEYTQSRDEIYEILKKNQHRILSFGLENYLDQSWWAAKSGTSRHFVDGWTCGIHREKELITCVRAGNYDGSPMKKSWIQTAGYLRSLVVSIL